MRWLPKPWFLLGDVISVVVTGIVVAVVCKALIPAEWNMVLAMFPGMAIGMFLPMPLCFLAFSRFWGAMEVMVPVMLAGMMSGMWVAMALTMHPAGYGHVAMMGGVIALLCLLFCYAMNVLEIVRSQHHG